MGYTDGFLQFSILEELPLVLPDKKGWPYEFILGADDPEMTEIEKILTECRQHFQYAIHDGARVLPGNAYKADSVEVRERSIAVLIECEPKECCGLNVVVRIIDHHRLGDPGFDLPLELFWEASSLGQLYKLLKLGVPTQEHLTLAALDHCMVPARQGKCPGVDPEVLKRVSREHIAVRKGVDISKVEACIHEMRKKLETSYVVTIGTQDVFDFTRLRMKTGYSLEYLCTLEALADMHKVALVRKKSKKGHPDKIVICGGATYHTIRFFIDTWAADNGIINVYGVPMRGYAGGDRK